MLILAIRSAFVLLATFIGLTNGHYFFEDWSYDLPHWFGGAMGFAIAITIIAVEQAFRRHFNRLLVAFLVGTGAGLLLSFLLLTVLELAVQDEHLRRNLDVPLTLLTTYLVLITVLRNADRFRLVVPFVEFRSDAIHEGSMVLDVSALADGRLAVLVHTGLLAQRVLVHRQVLARAESLTRADEPRDQLKGQAALTMLAQLRDSLGEALVIDDSDVPQAENLNDVLIGLARLEDARLITDDTELATRARTEGLRIVEIGALAQQFAPVITTGEAIEVALEKIGENAGQAVGFLDDGSMVVVAGAAEAIGQRVQAKVVRIHHTKNGRMIFAEPAAESTT